MSSGDDGESNTLVYSQNAQGGGRHSIARSLSGEPDKVNACELSIRLRRGCTDGSSAPSYITLPPPSVKITQVMLLTSKRTQFDEIASTVVSLNSLIGRITIDKPVLFPCATPLQRQCRGLRLLQQIGMNPTGGSVYLRSP